MSLRGYRDRPAAYFHGLYGKEREDELRQAVKDVIDRPVVVATTILKLWARRHNLVETSSMPPPSGSWVIASTETSVEVVATKHLAQAILDLQERYHLPTIFPSGLTLLDYKVDSFDSLAEILSIVNPFWLLEFQGCGLNQTMASGDYFASDDDLKYIRNWLINEFSLTPSTLLKSLSYPLDRRDDGEPRNTWLNRHL